MHNDSFWRAVGSTPQTSKREALQPFKTPTHPAYKLNISPITPRIRPPPIAISPIGISRKTWKDSYPIDTVEFMNELSFKHETFTDEEDDEDKENRNQIL